MSRLKSCQDQKLSLLAVVKHVMQLVVEVEQSLGNNQDVEYIQIPKSQLVFGFKSISFHLFLFAD